LNASKSKNRLANKIFPLNNAPLKQAACSVRITDSKSSSNLNCATIDYLVDEKYYNLLKPYNLIRWLITARPTNKQLE